MKELYNIPVLGKYFLYKKVNKEGGDKESITLRNYTSSHYNVHVGMYTYGGCFDRYFNNGRIKINVGRYCSFASNIRCFGANHPMEHAIMSPYFYNPKWSGLPVKDVQRTELEIGHDVWIGYGVIITSKCTRIGNGAVIAAGSIVTKDVPSYSVVVGSPAKIVKYRFDKETIALLEKSKWYDMKPKELMKFYDSISCPAKFAQKILDRHKGNANG